jgi:hypothetical protein
MTRGIEASDVSENFPQWSTLLHSHHMRRCTLEASAERAENPLASAQLTAEILADQQFVQGQRLICSGRSCSREQARGDRAADPDQYHHHQILLLRLRIQPNFEHLHHLASIRNLIGARQ